MDEIFECGLQCYCGFFHYGRALQVRIMQLMLQHDVTLGIWCGLGKISLNYNTNHLFNRAFSKAQPRVVRVVIMMKILYSRP